MRRDKEINAFFILVRAGLFGQTDCTESTESVFWQDVNWGEVYQLAEEQSVIGLVAAGIDRIKAHVPNYNCPQEWVLQFIGSALQLEQQNKGMNTFIGKLVDDMRKAGIYTLLVKGQGLAQCYEKPLWRSCCDVDLLLRDDNYQKAKDYLLPKASFVEDEEKHKRHLAMTINEWMVELHGSLRCGFSSRIDKSMDRIYDDTFYGGNVRSWNNGGVQVFMLGKENDVLYVFVHLLNHFYKGGVGLRQICDWCRLLWTYKDSLDHGLLESRIREMGLMSEWKAFGAYVVEYLGMDAKAVPFLNIKDNVNINRSLKRQAEKIKDFILMSGNMGSNRMTDDAGSKSYLTRKISSFVQRVGDLINHARIFPLDSIRFFPSIVINGIRQK